MPTLAEASRATFASPPLKTTLNLKPKRFAAFACCLHLALPAVAGEKNPAATYNRAEDSHPFTVFMQEGGWCWFQDPRAIIHDGILLMGGVQGNGSGAALIGVYDLEKGRRMKSFLAKNHFDRDDHNSPVFHPRRDGSVLAMYARHGREKVHYYRISNRHDFSKWGEEMQIDHSPFLAGRDQVTYMNIYRMGGKLYNFYRGLAFNPCFVTSSDDGLTWGEDTHFIKSEIKGRHRPYVRYAGNGVDTVQFSFTDGHPDQFGNSIYFASFREGTFFRADGSLIKDLAAGGALKPSEAELVFKGSGSWAPQGRASAERSAWTSSMAIDSKGHPHIGYSLHLTNQDHRYRIASWTGSKWIDREVAFAGHCLYDTQTSYTGLISLDPVDPSIAVISTNVDPSTGNPRGPHHEIYRAKIGPDDTSETISWIAVTRNSPVRNLRPVIVRNDKIRVIAWLRGEFKSYTSYQLDVVGHLEKVN